jgi:hypothetical protein
MKNEKIKIALAQLRGEVSIPTGFSPLDAFRVIQEEVEKMEDEIEENLEEKWGEGW